MIWKIYIHIPLALIFDIIVYARETLRVRCCICAQRKRGFIPFNRTLWVYVWKYGISSKRSRTCFPTWFGESFHTLLFGLILIDAQRYFKSSFVNRKNVKKPFAHESLENPLSCVSKCASENFHTLLFGLILNQATALLQFMMA